MRERTAGAAELEPPSVDRALRGLVSGMARDIAVLAERGDSTVVRFGDTVFKAHAPGTDREALALRLAVAAHPLLAGTLLAPLPLPPQSPTAASTDSRPVTAWPYGEPVARDTEPEAAPWEAAAGLLARLHSIPPAPLTGGRPLPPMRGPAKAARAVARMRATGRPDAAVLKAWSLLPGWARDEVPQPPDRRALCHGDLHLGQLVRHPAPYGAWRLIDVDDLGVGDPAWDLARPAMWFAAGVLEPGLWARFLGGYRAAGGTAVPADGDPWPYLDVPARALSVQTAAIAVAKCAEEGRVLDETEQAVLGACRRIAEVS
jgi:aminoglycoside phosphotransferase (APT) family kinase protein